MVKMLEAILSKKYCPMWRQKRWFWSGATWIQIHLVSWTGPDLLYSRYTICTKTTYCPRAASFFYVEGQQSLFFSMNAQLGATEAHLWSHRGSSRSHENSHRCHIVPSWGDSPWSHGGSLRSTGGSPHSDYILTGAMSSPVSYKCSLWGHGG